MGARCAAGRRCGLFAPGLCPLLTRGGAFAALFAGFAPGSRFGRLADQAVGAYKAKATLPPADPGREKEQIARLRRLAEESELDPEFTEKFLRFIIDEVIRHHEQARRG